MSSFTGSTKKPDDMYRIIEHFALGKRRLELFGEDHNIRPGWLTLGKDLSYSNFNKEVESWIFNFYAHAQSYTRAYALPRAPHINVISAKKLHSYRRITRTLRTAMGRCGREAAVETLPLVLRTSS